MNPQFMKYITLFAFALPLLSFGQLQPLTHDDYDQWKSISAYPTTHDGSLMAVQTSPQEGDSYVDLIRVRNGRRILRLERASRPQFTSNGKWLFVQVSPPYDEVRELKLKDTDKDDMPKDHLVRVNTSNGRTDTIFNVARFDVHTYYEANIAILLEDEPKVEEESDSTEAEEVNDLIWDGDDEHGEGFYSKNAKRLVVWNIYTNKKDTIERVTDFMWARQMNTLVGVQSAGDSTQPSRYFTLDAGAMGFDNTGFDAYQVLQDGFEDIAQFTIDRHAYRTAWLSTSDSDDADVRYYDLNVSHMQGGGTSQRVFERTRLPEDWMMSPHSSLNFSHDMKVLYFGTMRVPFVPEEDTTILDDEKVSLDIWSWNDIEIQPMQKVNASDEKKKSYQARWDLELNTYVQIEDDDLESVSVSPRYTEKYAIGFQTPDDEELAISWYWPPRRDFFIVDVTNGDRSRIASGVRSYPQLSPNEKYAYWWDGSTREWKGYNIETGQSYILSANIPNPVYDEEHDTPSEPGAYGTAGWTENDEAILIYDAFDIWKVTPGGRAVNLTNRGRTENTRYRYVNVVDYERNISGEEWILSAFNESDKSTAYVELDIEDSEFEELIGGDFRLSSLRRADSADVYFFRKETTIEYPEIYGVRGDDLKDARKLTNTNPQQDQYRWGTSELVEWTSPKGIELQGILLKPEDFDPNKKYPLLVYFYETYSDLLHNYWNPRPSASTINFPYFLSNEYIIFIPDIVYQEGYPGASAEECIISGTQHVAQNNWIDASRMAIQGQSWGGYQVAHLVTRTDIYACAMAGAPVSNMTSAYGGIRWGSGMSREFQYERTQSRIGGTLWERMDLYLENSPVFYADQVETPLLMMHNDGDGAVPWYQGIEYFMALRRLRKPAWMLVYNGEEHNLMQRHNRMDLSIRMGQFFDHYLKGAPAPEWMVNGRPYLQKEYNPATDLIDENDTND